VIKSKAASGRRHLGFASHLSFSFTAKEAHLFGAYLLLDLDLGIRRAKPSRRLHCVGLVVVRLALHLDFEQPVVGGLESLSDLPLGLLIDVGPPGDCKPNRRV
jgi:hypothetical protein